MKKLGAVIQKNVLLLVAVVLATIVGGATTAVVLAAIPDSSGKINACYRNSTQILKVTDPAGNCANNETPISWRQDGGQIISNHISIPFGTANNQTILTIPDLGEANVVACVSEANQAGYTNSTSHDVFSSVGNFVPGDGTTGGSDVMFTHTSGGVRSIAYLSIASWNDEVNGQCHFFAQATISED